MDIQTILMPIAVAFTAIYAIMVVSTFFGGDFDSESDIDEGNEYFTFRNLLAVLIGLGWGGLYLMKSGFSNTTAILGGLGIGMGYMFIQLFVFKAISKLNAPNTPSNDEYIGRLAVVSLPIPVSNNSTNDGISITTRGFGKVDLGGKEFVATSSSALERGDVVKIIDFLQNVAVVEKTSEWIRP